jgi:hypothetical protein
LVGLGQVSRVLALLLREMLKERSRRTHTSYGYWFLIVERVMLAMFAGYNLAAECSPGTVKPAVGIPVRVVINRIRLYLLPQLSLRHNHRVGTALSAA